MAAPTKKIKTDHFNEENDEKLLLFLNWMKSEEFFVSDKVRVSKKGSCNAYGMIAAENINEDELLFTIPRGSVLCQENCAIKKELKEDEHMLQSEAGWVPLVLTVLYEYFNPESKWRPYLDLFPCYSTRDHPMFWESDVLKSELGITGLIECVQRDLNKMRKDYNDSALPFMKKHRNLFRTSEALDFEMYKKVVAFIMAYSFTDDTRDSNEDDDSDDETDSIHPSATPMMVPLADVLNHVTNHNAQVVYKKECLEMRSIRSIKKNEEVFNTYGHLSNSELLHMYGFAQPYPQNTDDVVNVSFDVVIEEFANRFKSKDSRNGDDLEVKMTYLKDDFGVENDDNILAIGTKGLVDAEMLCRILKVLFDKSFLPEKHNDDDRDVYEEITYESLRKLPYKWLDLLYRSAVTKSSKFSQSLSEDENVLNSAEKLNALSRRQKWAIYVRYGQQKLLETFINSISKAKNSL